MPWPRGLDRGYPSAAGVAGFAELRSAGTEIFKHGCLQEAAFIQSGAELHKTNLQ